MKNEAAEYLVTNCIDSYRKDVLIIYDDTTEDIVDLFYAALLKHGKNIKVVKLDVAHCHGEEPHQGIAERMLGSEAIMCITQYSLAHTEARKKAEKKGITFLSMPEYCDNLLCNQAIFVDYHAKLAQVKKYTDFLTKGEKVEVETESGSRIYLDIQNRIGNCCPGMTTKDFLLGSPPDIEANIAPIENKTNGRLVVDGSITDYRIGLLKEPVVLNIEEGFIQDIKSSDKKIEKMIDHIFSDIHSPNAYVVGEFGIGINDCAQLCGNMLVDEGVKGCVHFGMGSNWTIGGKNRVNFHLDFVIKNATVIIDDKVVIDKGELIYDK